MDLSSQTLPAGRPLTAEWVYRRYAKAIRQYFLKRVRNPAEAEDLTSELLLRVSQNADRSVQNPEGFIFSIAANLLRDRYRHQQVVDRGAEAGKAFGISGEGGANIGGLRCRRGALQLIDEGGHGGDSLRFAPLAVRRGRAL